MADPALNWRVIVWRINAWSAVILALVNAFAGKAECFAWAVAAWVEFRIADYLIAKKGDQDNV